MKYSVASRTIFRSIIAGVLLIVLMTGYAVAQSRTYNYTGTTYDSNVGPYTTSDRLTATFTTDPALSPGFSGDASAQITSLTFDDGVKVRTLADSTLCQFDITTDSSGDIVGWSIFIRQSDTAAGENQHSVESYGPNSLDFDQVGSDLQPGNTDCGSIVLDPLVQAAPSGSWATAGSTARTVPTLSLRSLMLLIVILGGLGIVSIVRHSVR